MVHEKWSWTIESRITCICLMLPLWRHRIRSSILSLSLSLNWATGDVQWVRAVGGCTWSCETVSQSLSVIIIKRSLQCILYLSQSVECGYWKSHCTEAVTLVYSWKVKSESVFVCTWAVQCSLLRHSSTFQDILWRLMCTCVYFLKRSTPPATVKRLL